ncbi:twin-arginine translocase subunit TatC [Halosimplex salinum]|uniref:twin-arginine translocase subunit TatC n=1 Tax=Halosimplex salinum TaxID=1710538 RepID=UPI000F480B58|nr:twin-arginine translocase subunit TatC [Halosimplex salinum]
MAAAIDEDTKQTVAQGRATLGSLIGSARDDLRKAFLVFVFGFMGTFYALRLYVWDNLKADLNQHEEIRIVATTPFDVILLQAKIGIFVGILITIPVLIYYGRDALRARGWWPAEDVPRWKLAFPATLSVVLFAGGLAYAYYLFFPLMLGFLAGNAVNAGFEPTWSIVKWTQFIAFLGLSFGLAAQLPLVMSLLAYLRIASYQAMRDRWRYAVMGIFVFGAFFSPPDPLTQIMWALPLVGLYAFSLALARFAELLRRSADEVSARLVVGNHWNELAALVVLAFGLGYLVVARYGVTAVNEAFAILPEQYQRGPFPSIAEATGLDPQLVAVLVGIVVALVALGVGLFAFAFRELDAARDPTEPMGSPSDIDLLALDAAAIPATPPERFEEMNEGEATELAREALQDQEDPDKAQAILDRFDEVQEAQEARAEAESEGGEGTADGSDGATADDEEGGGILSSTTAGVVDSFTEEETTEDDIGGYYYDIAFILESLTSRAFRLVAVFGVVMAATFVFLYQGGIGTLKEVFFSRMPESQEVQANIVTLHPAEALIFEIKFATLLGLVATLPLILYYIWPALKERGLVGGDRRLLGVWAVTLLVGIVGGSLFGFLYVAPAIISWLAADAIQSSMVIHYRINNFGWLVVATTVGVGLLVEVPVTMFLFHRGRLITFQSMFDRWRTVVMAIIVTAAFITPSSLLTMLVFSIPTAGAYMVGLGILWLYTLGGRRTPRREGEAAD